eukprot:4030568-Prorocentrum_lima.AAC.1
MTSSLVGSEMCIRDRLYEAPGQRLSLRRHEDNAWFDARATADGFRAVSYTHLTLPTICSV